MKTTLITCPACGRTVSRNAAACPACAEPINTHTDSTGRVNLRDPVHVLGVAVSVIVVLGILAALCVVAVDSINSASLNRTRARNQAKAAEARR